jgi:hypothetical protein
MQGKLSLKQLAAGALATLAGIAAAEAHHSYGATYDVKNEIRLEGELVQFQFRNPHSFVQVEAPDEHGQMQRWSVEWSGTGALLRQGVDRATLRPGDEVVITARPSRAPGERRVLMLTLLRPLDGLSWGNRPDEVTD